MRRSSWKRAERRIAEILGGKRIPITGRRGPDIEHPLLSIEVKARASLSAYLKDWLAQAEEGATGDKVAIVVVHEAGRPHRKDLVMMRLADFVKLIGGN